MSKQSAQTIAERLLLDGAGIDEAAARMEAFLSACGTPAREITRARLSAEEALGAWRRALGEEAYFTLTCRRRFSRLYIVLCAQGARVDPLAQSAEDEALFGERSLMARLSMGASYAYHDGVNELLLSPPAKAPNQMLTVGIAAALAVLIGALMGLLPEQARVVISQDVVSPFFDALLNLLSTIATPLIFLAVCSGIYNIGDLTLLGRVGKRLVLRFVAMTFLVLAVALLCTVWFFQVTLSAEGAGSAQGAKAIYRLLLSIIPSDIATPFITGNALQVIFIGCACGMGILILGRKVSALMNIIEQLHNVVRLLMSAIGRLVPFFVFACILDIVLSGGYTQLFGIQKQLALCLAAVALCVLAYALALKRKTGARVSVVLKKLMPTFLVAVTTASSAAAFSVNTDTCRDRLGVSDKMVDFGVPLGQVLFMPAGALAFLFSAMCIGELYHIVITPVWLLVAVLVSGILAIATPPIPGGALSCYTVLFTQLGIPAEGIALAISVDLVMDFLLTAFNLSCLQLELTLQADKLCMLDKERLLAK